MATILELAQLSAAVYGDKVPCGWTLIATSLPNSDHYFGQAYRNDESGEIVIANRGTQLVSGSSTATNQKGDLILGLRRRVDGSRKANDVHVNICVSSAARK